MCMYIDILILLLGINMEIASNFLELIVNSGVLVCNQMIRRKLYILNDKRIICSQV